MRWENGPRKMCSYRIGPNPGFHIHKDLFYTLTWLCMVSWWLWSPGCFQRFTRWFGIMHNLWRIILLSRVYSWINWLIAEFSGYMSVRFRRFLFWIHCCFCLFGGLTRHRLRVCWLTAFLVGWIATCFPCVAGLVDTAFFFNISVILPSFIFIPNHTSNAKLNWHLNITLYCFIYCNANLSKIQTPHRTTSVNHPILTLNAPITTKVVCFSRLLKCLRSLHGKQCVPRSDCSYRSSLLWVHTVCIYTWFVSNVRQLFAADDFSRRHFQMLFFSRRFKG